MPRIHDPHTGVPAGHVSGQLRTMPDRPEAQSGELLLDVREIESNPFQPRRDFGDAEIASLAESLKSHNMLQPVLVRRHGDRWQLISGERRLRAAVAAGWTKIPARVRQADDRLVAELAIVENLQRKDLNPLEKALSFQRYLREHRCTQEELGSRLKIDRSTIANLMRLLELPERVQDALRRGVITAGHARALLPLGDEREQIAFCRRIRDERLNVRDVERMVQERIRSEEERDRTIDKPESPPPRPVNHQVASLEQELRRVLGTQVDIKAGRGRRGRIVIHFRGSDEFDRLLHYLLDDSLP
jgi:ParB family chromosome partitioning protein